MNNNQSNQQGVDAQNQKQVSQEPNLNSPTLSDPLQSEDDKLVVQQVTNTFKGPKRYHVKKVLATIFGLVILVLGVAAGVFLVQDEQEFRERAGFGGQCEVSENCILLIGSSAGTYQAETRISSVIFDLNGEVREYAPPGTTDDCFEVVINQEALEWNSLENSSSCPDIQRVQVWTKR